MLNNQSIVQQAACQMGIPGGGMPPYPQQQPPQQPPQVPFNGFGEQPPQYVAPQQEFYNYCAKKQVDTAADIAKNAANTFHRMQEESHKHMLACERDAYKVEIQERMYERKELTSDGLCKSQFCCVLKKMQILVALFAVYVGVHVLLMFRQECRQ